VKEAKRGEMMAAFLFGAVDFLTAILLFSGFNNIPGPDWLKAVVIGALVIKGIISFTPAR